MTAAQVRPESWLTETTASVPLRLAAYQVVALPGAIATALACGGLPATCDVWRKLAC